ncbi:hypothetical protein VTN00DRAFT_6050 [Thermoascus crustaceus]|uniref:uncharacterized protein n=1 Tax=Thermoascus crustaceus TaxID=5088 RepID=UPI0037445380
MAKLFRSKKDNFCAACGATIGRIDLCFGDITEEVAGSWANFYRADKPRGMVGFSNCDMSPYGYPIHAKCWSLIERYGLCGDRINQQQLEHLITAIRQRRYFGPYGLEDLDFMERSSKPCVPFCNKIVFDNKMDDDVLFQVDPLDIPEVKKLVKKNIKAKKSIKVVCDNRRTSRRLRQRSPYAVYDTKW